MELKSKINNLNYNNLEEALNCKNQIHLKKKIIHFSNIFSSKNLF
jgi:hypothetical protein